jgi:hypothetical protein
MNMITNMGIQTGAPDLAVLACGVSYIAHLPEICLTFTFLSLLVLVGAHFTSRKAGKPLNLCRLASASRWWGMIGLFLFIVFAWSLLFRVNTHQPIFAALNALAFLAAPLTALATIVAAHRARWRIRKSNGALTGKAIAGSGLLTGYTTILLGLLFVVTVNANVRYRSYNSCINNLRQLDGAKEQWALENKKTATDTPTMNDLIGTDKYIKVAPTCPANGAYTLGNMSTKPTCSVADHTLS